jgi:AcrR family transcriptional regulator
MNIVHKRRKGVMSTGTRRRQQKAELRSRILEAAREIFVREGWARVSMRRLADKIDYSPGTIYLHFRSKEALLSSLVEESFASLAHALESTGRSDPLETLRRGLRTYVDFGLGHPNHYHFAFLERPGASAARGYKPHRAFDYLCCYVRSCMEAGLFRNVNVEISAQVLWAAVHGITSLLITRPYFPWAGRDKIIDEVIDNSIRGFLAEEGRPETSRPVRRGRNASAGNSGCPC